MAVEEGVYFPPRLLSSLPQAESASDFPQVRRLGGVRGRGEREVRTGKGLLGCHRYNLAMVSSRCQSVFVRFTLTIITNDPQLEWVNSEHLFLTHVLGNVDQHVSQVGRQSMTGEGQRERERERERERI